MGAKDQEGDANLGEDVPEDHSSGERSEDSSNHGCDVSKPNLNMTRFCPSSEASNGRLERMSGIGASTRSMTL
jgi:hypothetical protein